jgi:hypothetical protein
MQHPYSMQRVRLAVISGLVAAALLVAGLVAAATQASPGSDEEAAVTQPAGSSAAAPQLRPHGQKVGKSGPPAWARAHKHHPTGDHADKAWKDAWHAMTPAQRERRMTELARTHRQGMRQWAECVAAAGEDSTQRSACVKPLPPGLAKRR